MKQIIKRTQSFITIFIAFLSLSCHDGMYAKEWKATGVDIPFQYTRGAMIIDMEIGGKTYPMLFDSGATMCVTPELWEALGLEETKEEVYNDSQGNRVVSKRAGIPPFSIGGKHYEGFTAMLLDIGNIPGMSCYGVCGVVGPEVIGNTVWTMDFARKVITVSDSVATGENTVSVPLVKRFYGQPWFYLETAKGDSILTCFDTGSNGGLSLDKREASRAGLDGVSHAFWECGFTGSGGGGYGRLDTVQYVWAGKGVRIGALGLADAVVKLHSKPSNIMGTQIMKRFLVSLDYRNGRLLISPNGTGKQGDEERSRFGITFGYSAGRIIVATVRGKEEKDFPDVPVGAQVVAVNGKRVPVPATSADLCGLLSSGYASGDVLRVKFLDGRGREQEVRILKSAWE